MPCATAAAPGSRTLCRNSEVHALPPSLLALPLVLQVSPGAWSCSVPPRVGWAEGCPSAWGARPGGWCRGLRPGKESRLCGTGDVGGWEAGHLQSCLSDLWPGPYAAGRAVPAARSAPGRGVRSVRSLYQAVGRAAEGGMLVGEVALNSCSCTVWVGASGRGARYQSVLPLP